MKSEAWMLSLMVLLWLALVCLLGSGCYRAFQKKERKQGYLLLIFLTLIVVFTGPWAVFFLWLIGCYAGLPIACVL